MPLFLLLTLAFDLLGTVTYTDLGVKVKFRTTLLDVGEACVALDKATTVIGMGVHAIIFVKAEA